MKQLLQRSIQAILDAEMVLSRETRDEAGASSDERTTLCCTRKLKTALGPISLQLAASDHVRFLSQLFSRYPAEELNFLLLLGRILVRGYASSGAVREMVERLCGHPFDGSQLAVIGAAIEQELPDYFQREFERGHGYTRVWRHVHPRSGLPRVQLMHNLFPKVRSNEA